MSTLAIHVVTTRSGAWPEKISAAAWGIDNAEILRVEALIRPRDGERTSETMQRIAESEGLEGDDVKCALRLIGGMSQGKWTGLMKGARLLIVHDYAETDRCIRLSRSMFGMAEEWRRPALRVIDTLDIARTLIGTEAKVSLAEAAKAITGRDLRGCDALIGLFNRPEAADVVRAA